MPAGLQVFNTFGNFQIDGEYKNLGLLRKETITTVQDSDYQAPVATFLLNPGEIFALRCETTGVAVVWTEGNVITVKAGSTSSSHDVDCYIFGDPSATSTFGLQVFSSSGGLIFDSSEKPLNVVSVFSGEGTFNGTPGRIYAAIPSNQHVVVFESQGPVVQPPDNRTLRQIFIDGGMFLMTGEDIDFVDTRILSWSSVTSGSTPPPYSDWTYDNGVTNTHVIVDVTGF